MDEVNEKSKMLIIELAKSLNVDFPKDRTCKDCFYYDHGDKITSAYRNQHSCWESHQITVEPCDPDDMSHKDYKKPYKITELSEATKCPYYKSGLKEYKKLYNQSKQELEELKDSIKDLCGM